MPQYANSGTNSLTLNPVSPIGLQVGDEAYVLGTTPLVPGQSQKATDSNVVFEAVAIGERSLAVTFQARPGGGSPPAIQVQVNASANPGAAEIDIQDAAIDADGAYLTPTGSASYKLTTWTQNDAIFTAWAEISPEVGRFSSLKIVANPNAVSFAAKYVYV